MVRIIKYFIFFASSLVILLIIIFLLYCGKENDNMNISYEEGIMNSLVFENYEGVYEGEFVPNKETAIEIAKIVLDRVLKTETGRTYNSIFVFYDIEKELWVVTFGKKNTLGDCVSIAIRKSDAKIVKVWSGE